MTDLSVISKYCLCCKMNIPIAEYGCMLLCAGCLSGLTIEEIGDKTNKIIALRDYEDSKKWDDLNKEMQISLKKSRENKDPSPYKSREGKEGWSRQSYLEDKYYNC